MAQPLLAFLRKYWKGQLEASYMHSPDGLWNHLNSLLQNLPPWLPDVKHKVKSLKAADAEVSGRISEASSIWPELFRCMVFYTQLLVHLLQLFFCWSCVFLANPTTWKNSCLCSHSKYCSVAGAILVFGNQSTLMRSTTAQLWRPRPLYKYLAGSYSITGLCVRSANRSS